MHIITNVFSTAIIEKYEQRKKRFYPMKMVFYKPVSKIFSSYVLNSHMHKVENFEFVSKIVMKHINLLNLEKKIIQSSIAQLTEKNFFQKLSNNLSMMTFEKTFVKNKKYTQVKMKNIYKDSANKQNFIYDFINSQKPYLSPILSNHKNGLPTRNHQNNNYRNIENTVRVENMHKDSERKYFSLQEYLFEKHGNKNIFTPLLKNNFEKNNRHTNNITTYLEHNIHKSNKKYANKNEITYLQPIRSEHKIYHRKENMLYFYQEKEFENAIDQIKETIFELKEKVTKVTELKTKEKAQDIPHMDYTHLSTQIYQDFEEKLYLDKQRKGL